MATTGKREYSIVINGVSKSITDVTKLEKALATLDAALNKERAATVNVTEVTTKKNAATAKATEAATKQTKALTDQEKAEKKLADTKARTAQVDNDLNKAQIAATRELQQRTREVTRAVIQEQFAEDSIAAMGMQLTDLRLDYEKLTAAQRADVEVGGALLEQIQTLDAEYKALRESTGNFRDSVGNYEKALKGLGDLKDGLDKTRNGTTGLAAEIVGSNDVLDAFGDTAQSAAVASEGLQGAISLGTQAAEIYNLVVKEGVIQQKAAAVIDGIRTVQLKAKTAAEAAATKGTIAGTIAQAAFNLVASANPYVLLALALVAVGAALLAFASRTDDAAEKQKQFNDLQAIALDQLDQYAVKAKAAGDIRVTQLENELAVLTARGAKTAEIRAAEDNLARERSANNARLRGFYGQEIDDLEKNRQKIEQLREVLAKLNAEKAKGEDTIKLDIDLDGKVDKAKIDEAVTAVQGQIDNLGRSVQVAVDLKADRQAIENEARVLAASRAKEDKDRRKEQAAAELADLRTLQDNKAKLLSQSFDDQRAALRIANAREIEDLRIRLRTDETLTARSRELINANIVTLGKVLAKQLVEVGKEQRAAELQGARDVIDSRNALIIGATDRLTEELKTKYTRQIHDLENRLKNETELTVTQQAYISEQILNAQTLRDRELAALAAAGLEERASAELAKIEDTLAQEKDKITKFTGELEVRSKTGLKLIDVDATKKNLSEANKALDDYIKGLVNYQGDLNAAHTATLATLQAGTPEYTAELDKYSKATADNAKKIAQSQNEQAENTRASKDVELEAFKESSEKIAAIAQNTVDLFTQGGALVAASIQGQVEALNASLDAISEKYDNAKDLQDKAVQAVQDTEAQLQDATGGTATALKEQLATQMAARNEAARQEQRLAKEKAKLEADIAKKEKQAKRIQLLSDIAQATANGYKAVTEALAAYPPPFSYIAAAVTGALATVQVASMSKQLTKLADGGEIKGPSHAQGGVNIGLGYEAEGGEFMVNKQAYSNNTQLVRFINESSGAVSAEDLVGLIPGGSQMVISESTRNSNADIVEAIDAIDMRPVVSVQEINDVSDQITSVQELAGY